jgi:TPR repeat protein
MVERSDSSGESAMSQSKGLANHQRHGFRFSVPLIGALLAYLYMFPAFAGTEAGIKAFRAEDYVRAYEELRPAAEDGDAKAQYYFGKMYTYGRKVSTDSSLAYRWYLKAAKSGYPKAQATVAYALDEGIGVERDDGAATEWYRKAAEQGHVIAQRNLGLMYEAGEGVERDYEQAFHWFRQATEQGDARSVREIGEIFYYGHGPYPLDYEQAIRWYCRGAYQDDGGSQYALYGLYLQGLGVPSDTVTAFTWAAFAAEQGYPGGEQAWSRADSYLSGDQKARIAERVASNDKPRKYCRK